MNAPLFPISPLLPQIQQHLAAHQRLVLEAPPGAGKTTQVPLALLDAPWLQGRKIILLEPRRVAARSAALFMARQLGEEVGGTVGYRIRFENKVSARTRIEVVTEGILTRVLRTTRCWKRSVRSCSTNSTSAISAATSAWRWRWMCRRSCAMTCAWW